MARRSGEILSQRKRRGATPRTAIPACLRIIVAVLVLGAIAGGAHAQIPDPQPQQPYPLPEQTYPPPVVGAPEFQPQPPAAPVPASASPSSTVRNLFAGTLAAVMQAAGTSVAVGLTQAITGGLTSWFNRKAKAQAQPMPIAPPPAPTQFFDPQTGSVATADPMVMTASQSTAAAANTLFAGLAYEVHLQDASGAAFPVDPATHEFRTGERFVVFYRPTLPGHMEVFNINPAGTQSRIDAVEIAAGQLAQLGPYEFAAMKGDEVLRLVLTPCTTPALVSVTRDIVNVSAAGPGFPDASAPAQSGLAVCGSTGMTVRGIGANAVRTRDIRKVAVEGTTGFALDAVSPAELTSGNVAAREVSIVLRHR